MSSQIPETPPTAAHAKADTNSLGELLGDLTRDLSTLMRQELELAKVEAKQSATRAGKGGGMLAGAGVAGHFVLLFLSIALWYALGGLMGLGWSAVVVAVIWGIIAAILASVGRKELKKIKGMPQTAETIQEIPPTLKPNGENR
ncbi:phage holin family protein [Arthrobacter sp. ISL-72]|uniref:phage holin family protein n=1 Tax=Arthrobacter sp. ISL-72 TaxID=2819114 RepID=UPI001BEA66F0|nr:phage holin family protein [Arthrobacter sp. ISL-72]MBT2594264.1 phage holin family protein [Arthrobacter sp. ISL-72]